MSDYIKREEALDVVNGWRDQLIPTYGKNDEYVKCLETVAEHLETLHAADVREVVRGEWIMNDECRTVCSLCGNVVAFVSHADKRWEFGNFCPNCGSDMREEGKS